MSPNVWLGGGYTRTYNSLLVHTTIYYTFTLWAIDSWSDIPLDSDYFQLKFDAVAVTGPLVSVANFPNKVCGRKEYGDVGLRFFGGVAHNALSLIFQVISYLNQDSNDESFGFRDINLLFSLNTLTPPMCGLGLSTLPNLCSCPEGFVRLTTGGPCFPCDPSCASCYGTSSKKCYQCAPGYSYDGTRCFACDASCLLCTGPNPTQCVTCQFGLFLFQNNTCIPECNFPFIQTNDNCVKYCNDPCPTTQFLFWNNSCLNTCVSPLQPITILNSINQCVYPCESGNYLYWDGSCEASCSSPLTIRIESGAQFCDYKCGVAQYLYWSGSCSSTCKPPLVQRFDKGRQYCIYPCHLNDFLYFDQSCLSYCLSPLVSRTTASRKFCDYPCTNIEDFLYQDGTCKSTCPLPLRRFSLQKTKYCISPCSSDEFLFWNGSCISSCNSPLKTEVKPYGNLCNLPCDNALDYYHEETGECQATCGLSSQINHGLYLSCHSIPPDENGLLEKLLLIPPAESGATTFVVLNKLIQYVRFLNIEYPPRLFNLTTSRGREIFSLKLGSSMPANIKQSFTKHPVPSVFEKQNLHSSFIVNFWQGLSSIWIVLGFAISSFSIRILAKRRKWIFIRKTLDSLRFVNEWNLILMLFAILFGDIILFSSIELRTYKADSIQATISFILSLLMLASCVVFLVGSFYLSSRAQKLRTSAVIPENAQEIYKVFLKKWQGCQVLFLDYRIISWPQYQFFFIYILRFALPMVIASYCYSLPLMQAIIYVIISLIMMIYIPYKKPILSRLSHYQVLAIEGVMLIINVCVLVLVIIDKSASQYNKVAIFAGDIIILGSVTVNLLLVLFLALKVGSEIKQAWKLKREHILEKKVHFLHLLFLLIQQAGFGFEEAVAYNLLYQQLDSTSDRNLELVTDTEDEIQIRDHPTNGLSYNMNEEIILYNDVYKEQSLDTSNVITLNQTTINEAHPLGKGNSINISSTTPPRPIEKISNLDLSLSPINPINISVDDKLNIMSKGSRRYKTNPEIIPEEEVE